MPLRGTVPVKLHRKEDAEILQIGRMTCFLLEDGSHTDNRIAAVILMLPPGTEGPPMHWSRMHDECFFVVKGKIGARTSSVHASAQDNALTGIFFRSSSIYDTRRDN